MALITDTDTHEAVTVTRGPSVEQSWEDLQAIVFQGLGEASMCWTETPQGIFDSRNATRIGLEIMQAIKAHIIAIGGSTCDVLPYETQEVQK